MKSFATATYVLCSLFLVSCDEGADDNVKGGNKPAGGEEAPAPEPSGTPDQPGDGPNPFGPASSAKAQSWNFPRGSLTLQGRVHDRVLRQPEVAWSVELDGPVIGDAAIANDTVYVGTVMGTFYALALSDGKERWKFTAEDTIESAPMVALGKVFVGSNDRYFYCLDEETGKELWKVEGADKFSSGAIVVRSPDDTDDWVIVNGYDGICRCLRVTDGSEVWIHETSDQINSSPALVNETHIVFGGCDALVHTINLGDGTTENEVEVDAEITESVATLGSMTYSGNYANQVVAADAFGEDQKWVYEDKDFPFFSSPAVNEEFVFIGSRDKHLHAIDRESGVRRWKFKTGSRVDGSPIVFDDAVVFGSGDGRMYALNPKDGAELWRLDLGEGMSTAPAFAQGRLVIGGAEGSVFAIKAGKK